MASRSDVVAAFRQWPRPDVGAHHLRALAAECDAIAFRLQRKGAPDLETGRRWDQQAADLKAEATTLRRRAAVKGRRGRLRGGPARSIAIRSAPRAREGKRSGATRRTVAARAGPDDSSGSDPDDDPSSGELDALPGFLAVSERMFCHGGRAPRRSEAGMSAVVLPTISEPHTSAELRRHVLALLAALNGTVPKAGRR